MSKYQEALDYLKGGCLFGELSNDALENIEELVEKATPMKPFLLVKHKNPKKRQYQCPRCGNACLVRYAPFERNENRHCYHCGQKLDWSEEK